MNPYRKVKYFHVTYLGHYLLPLRIQYDFLGYCMESAGQDHTHMVLQVADPISKRNLLDMLQDDVDPAYPCNVRIDVHRNLNTMLGYHHGLGDKPRCDGFIPITPFDYDHWIKELLSHKKLVRCEEVASKNKMLIEKSMTELVDEGIIHLEKYEVIRRCKIAYIRDLEDNREELDAKIDTPWGFAFNWDIDTKRTHYWVYSKQPSLGKTTFANWLCEKYKGVIKSGEWTYWEHLRDDTDLIILDEFVGGLKYHQLNSICDGTFSFRLFMGGTVQLRKKPLVIVLSNKSIDEVYPNMGHLVKARFNEACIDE